MAERDTDDLDLDYADDEEADEPEAEQPIAEAKSDTKESGADKRIRDLQAKADAAEARANKLEKLVAGRDEASAGGSNDPERAALMQELREASLDAVYGEYPELREYSIDRGLIEGRSRAEMRDSASSLVGLIKAVETKARNRALREAGVKAEPAGASREAPKDFARMSQEELEKVISRAKSGGEPIW